MGDFTRQQWDLIEHVNGNPDGRDIHDLLLASTAPAEDKAAAAEYFGPGTGSGFLDGTAQPTSTYEAGRIAWAHGRATEGAMADPEYRRGLQDERTEQVNRELQALDEGDLVGRAALLRSADSSGKLEQQDDADGL